MRHAGMHIIQATSSESFDDPVFSFLLLLFFCFLFSQKKKKHLYQVDVIHQTYNDVHAPKRNQQQ